MPERAANDPAITPPVAAAMPDDPQEIWRDPELLRRWTITMLVETDVSHITSEQVAVAVAAHDRRVLQELRQNNPLRFADHIQRDPWRTWRWTLRQRSPGRPAGHAAGLVEAWGTVRFIQKMWRDVFGHCRRRDGMTALTIAAGYHGFTVAQLDNYRKNKKPRSRT